MFCCPTGKSPREGLAGTIQDLDLHDIMGANLQISEKFGFSIFHISIPGSTEIIPVAFPAQVYVTDTRMPV